MFVIFVFSTMLRLPFECFVNSWKNGGPGENALKELVSLLFAGSRR